MTIQVGNVVPVFTQIAPICPGAPLILPTTSTNGVIGTWSPAPNNTATTTYTFTPAAGVCSSGATMTVTVKTLNITPAFSSVASICNGATLAPLPTTSTNAITGTWSPALNNTATTTYLFTPDSGQCAFTATTTITVKPVINANVTFGEYDNIVQEFLKPLIGIISQQLGISSKDIVPFNNSPNSPPPSLSTFAIIESRASPCISGISSSCL